MSFPDVVNLATNPNELFERLGLTVAMIDDIVIDVLKSEAPIFDFDVTEHPIEDGSKISDGRIERPIIVSLFCIFTDAEVDAVGTLTKAMDLNPDSFFTTWQDKKDALYTLKDSEKVFPLTTEFDNYEDMVLSSVRPFRDPSNTRALFVQLDFKKVRIVSSDVSQVDENFLPKEVDEEKKENTKKSNRQQKKKQDKGRQQTEKPSEQQKSTLRSLGEGLGIYG